MNIRYLSRALPIVVGALFAPTILVAQQTGGTVSGTVVDAASRTPIASVRIQIVGTQRATIGDATGKFRLSGLQPGQYQLRALRIGFASSTQTVTIAEGSNATADFALTPVAISLEEVVTTATGETQRKKEQGTAVAVLQPKTPELATAQTASQLLTGKVAGVDVATTGGTVGSGSRIRIRGANSLSLDNEPLIIVDGIRYNNSFGGIGVGGQVPSSFNDINPEDIQDIQILKGPAAAAQYGTAAANGVIQITTKHGSNNKARWTGYAQGGTIQDVTAYPSNYAWVGTTSAGKRTAACTLDSQTRGVCTPNPDSLVSFNPLESSGALIHGHRGSYGMSVAGGSDQVNYYVSGNFDRQQGVFAVDQDQRAGGRANLNAILTPQFNVQIGSSYLADHIRLPQNDNNTLGIVSAALLGSAFKNAAGGYLNGQLPQVLYAINTRQDIQRYENTVNTTYQPLSWLTATGVFGLDYTNRYDHEVIPPNVVTFGSLPQGQVTSNPRGIYDYTANGTVSAHWSPRSSIVTTSSAGFQFTKELIQGTQAFGAGLLGGTGSLSGTSARFAVGQTNTDNKTIGGLVSEQVAYADRVFLTGAIRTDQNSAFGQNFGSITYPSISLSWVVNQEKWFPKSNLFNSLRLRAANGRSGQRPNFRDAITFFNEQTVTVGGADVPGVLVGGTGNPNLKPERATETELGFDAGFLDQRIGVEVTHYHKRTDDLLVAVPLAPSLGLTATQFQNLGAVLNTGWEYVLNLKVLDVSKAQFDVSMNASTNHNKLLTLGLLPTGAPVPPIVVNSDQQHRVGYALGSYWLKPISFKDANGDGIISRSEITVGDTAVYLGNILPTSSFSVTPNLTLFSWIRFSALIDHKGGYKLFDNTARFRCAFNNCRASYDKTVPLADQAADIAATALGTDAGYVENAAFTKLRELSVTFIASNRIASMFRTRGLNLTLAGRNLHTWTSYKGFDPEVNSTAGANFSTSDFLTIPPSRTWTARINVNF
ncbi:MAG TPA: SusC/RagA family TonB-linked outer membrane protein [Gemmatimonadaceae bacterium]|jgi:TonB-linked SusC/RagA family outer membrane protein